MILLLPLTYGKLARVLTHLSHHKLQLPRDKMIQRIIYFHVSTHTSVVNNKYLNPNTCRIHNVAHVIGKRKTAKNFEKMQ